MKPVRTAPSFPAATVVAILVAEIGAWEIASRLGMRSHPLVVTALCLGLVAALGCVLYDRADFE